MPQRKPHSRKIRELAEAFFAQLGDDADFPEDERADFVTSLVRQWITYDGNATFLLGDRQIFLRLGRTPLGKLTVVTEPGPDGWMRMLAQDWKLDVDDVLELNEQLNRGQSAEDVDWVKLSGHHRALHRPLGQLFGCPLPGCDPSPDRSGVSLARPPQTSRHSCSTTGSMSR